MNNSDTLTLFLESNNDSVLGIKIENNYKNNFNFSSKSYGFKC